MNDYMETKNGWVKVLQNGGICFVPRMYPEKIVVKRDDADERRNTEPKEVKL